MNVVLSASIRKVIILVLVLAFVLTAILVIHDARMQTATREAGGPVNRPWSGSINETNQSSPPTIQSQTYSEIQSAGNFAGFDVILAADPGSSANNTSILLKSLQFQIHSPGNSTAVISTGNYTIATIYFAWYGWYNDSNLSGVLPVTIKIMSEATGLTFYNYYNLTIMTSQQYITYISQIQSKGKILSIAASDLEGMNVGNYVFGAFVGVVTGFTEYYWFMSSPKGRQLKSPVAKTRKGKDDRRF